MDAIDILHSRAVRLMHKIKDRTLTNEKITNRVNWQPVSFIYKKGLLTYMTISDIRTATEADKTMQGLRVAICHNK